MEMSFVDNNEDTHPLKVDTTIKHPHHLRKKQFKCSNFISFELFSKFSLPFYQVTIIMIVLYGTVIPFNTIHSAFLQT